MDARSTIINKTRKNKPPKKPNPTKIHYLKELTPNAKTTYTIKVKALRVWNTYYMEAPSKANEINAQIWGEPVLNYNINMILMDEEGTKIHACANNYTIYKTASQKPLKEGAQLIISDFKCVPNRASIKPTENDAKIYFKKETCVTVTHDFNSESDVFEFVSFESINNNQISKDKAFDVVDQIISNKKLKKVSVDQKPTSLIEYELQNTSGQKIECVLWEDDADALQYYIDKNIATANPIMTSTREMPEIHAYHPKDIITIEDSEDEKNSEDDDVTSSKNFVLDDESDEHSATKVCPTKRRHGPNSEDDEDLKPNTIKVKTTTDIRFSMTEDEWLNDWESENCDIIEYYEDDDCYCPVCQGTCQCIPEEYTCSRH
ncbi:replication protein A 70 kDa DNA-binding subunit C [Artemisia annua]|uniref:Replication protein A 70 kDa DNA-binding subunit C n=1 Tax=Artemisia annua TaxID=35608 RepID=A0A2U1LDH4_ARTAN|nr:replication protein A 70 kDa DNA-binding subunit C [Artemisia annua]